MTNTDIRAAAEINIKENPVIKLLEGDYASARNKDVQVSGFLKGARWARRNLCSWVSSDMAFNPPAYMNVPVKINGLMYIGSYSPTEGWRYQQYYSPKQIPLTESFEWLYDPNQSKQQ